MISSIAIGTRGSALALNQANFIASLIRAHAPEMRVSVHTYKTQGDKILDAPLSKIGGKGLFTKELELALLSRNIDIAVHSMKDLPTELPEGLAIGAVPKRVTPYDALISDKFDSLTELPQGARLGTSSLRRSAQLRTVRPDVEIVDLRGNIHTRLEKVRNGSLDAAILACAGLERLGLKDRIRQIISDQIMLPAVGQGALAIEVRHEDSALREFLEDIGDPVTTLEVAAERALLGALGGGCQVPIGALAHAHGNDLQLRACVCSLDGQTLIRDSLTGSLVGARDLGLRLADRLIQQGADAIIASIR